MATEEPEKLAENTESDSAPNKTGTMSFPGDDPRHKPYVLEGWDLPPRGPRSTNWKTHIAGLRSLELRDDDIFLLAYPKAGTHWLWEVLSMLLQGKAQYDDRPKEQLMMEMSDLEKLEQTPSPRIFNSHLPFFMLPWKQMKEKKSKVLHVYRNPKDSCVSYYHHMKGFRNMDFSDYFELFFYGKMDSGNYFEHLKQVLTFTLENPDVPFLSLSFEDMKKNPVQNVKKLAKFLETDLSDEICEDIAEACSFQNLKINAELKKHPPFPHPPTPPSTPTSHGDLKHDDKKKPFFEAYRKGEIGDWKNYFTAEMNERVDPLIEEKMEGLPYILQYS
ncbi:sulfotransferase family cytosolic 1B member 1-like [Pomacea canaliculata]|uniref:sulfotransferase family cytosolic 1B member 1-like n=1 Tax=Pomacea canaliculata TaxID=400727 RepID=UPI000D72C5BD|nr:sulfotransferase family cytosolic 1B member 1-like [Pomacea canaliculata]XP_025090215.1 sulfotransferase family cytosolic 1B member 1-like [Pomacea canaliculata]